MTKTFLKAATLVGALTAVGLTLAPNPAQAFTLQSRLNGDPRPSNPQNLIVDLSIVSGEGSIAANQASWTVDINSFAYPNVKLDAFYFNLSNTIKSLVSFSNFSPSGWGIVSGTNAKGSGGADFDFGVDKTINSANDVTNTTSLTFLITANNLGRALLPTDFTNASFSTGAGGAISGQAGAHLIALGDGRSGFAVGKVPTPALLPGLIALGASVLRKRKGEQMAEANAEV